jgi:TPR repeat protein
MKSTCCILCLLLCLGGIFSLAYADNSSVDDAKSLFLEGRHKEAAKICSKHANSGNVEAQALLGFLYEHGHGVNKSHKEALRWYLKAESSEQIKNIQGKVDQNPNNLLWK